MSHLLDTNICSAHLKRPAGLMHHFTQHSGRLFIPSIVLGELYTWAYHRKPPNSLADRIENDLLADVQVLDYDTACAKEFGRVRGGLLRQGYALWKSNFGRSDAPGSGNLAAAVPEPATHVLLPLAA